MTEEAIFSGPSRWPGVPRRLRLLGGLAISLIFIAWAAYVFIELDRQLTRYKDARSDNRVWNMAQVEVDLQRLLISMLQAQRPQAPPDSLDSVLRDYDILYSRVQTVESGRAMANLPLGTSQGWVDLTGPDGLIRDMGATIDTRPTELAQDLPRLTERALANRPDLHRALSETLMAASAEGDVARQDLRRSLHIFSAAFGAALLVMALLLLAIVLQRRMLARHAVILESAVDNLRRVIDSSQDGVLIAEGGGRLRAVSRVAGAMLGLDATRIDTRNLSMHFPATVAELKGCTRLQTTCIRLEGSQFPVELSIVETTAPAGQRFRIVFLRDISEQLERENRLSEALAAARAGEEAKSRFVAVVSHEMRTPLNGLLSALELLESGTGLHPETRWLIEVMRGCGRTALEQVNNVLELTHLTETGGQGFDYTDFALGEVLHTQVQQFQAPAMLRGTLLTLKGRPCPDVFLHAPLQLVRRVLNNLISNAVKFTENGTITIECQRPEAGLDAFCIKVRDTGVGISQDDLDRIFHNFERLDTSYSRVQEGSGLGLGIAKLAAEALGGGITVESRLGEGSCFSFTFRAEPAKAPAPSALPPPHQGEGALRILVAEDNAINQALLQRQLERFGHEVTAVCDGIEALEAVELDAPFDVVLMDISMPRMDGITATRRLRMTDAGRHLPIIALTAQADQRRAADYRAAGMDEVVTKPVETARLLALIGKLAARQASGLDLPMGSSPSGGQGALDDRVVDELIEDMGAAFLQDLARRFGDEVTELLPVLTTALAAAEFDALALAAHRSAGSAAVLGLIELARALGAIEDAALARAPTLDQKLTALPDLWRRGQAALAVRLGPLT